MDTSIAHQPEPPSAGQQRIVALVVLIAFRALPWKTVLLFAIVVMGLPHLHTAIVTPVYVADQAATPTVEEPADETTDGVEADEEEMHAWSPYMGDPAVRIHSSGSFAEFTSYDHRFTARRWTSSWVNYLWMTVPLPLMMLGMLLGRSGFLGHFAKVRRNLKWIFGLGLAGGTALVALAYTLYGNVGATEAALIAVAVFAFQVLVCRLWLRAFRYGPAEWLWRTMTYWRRLPLATG